MVLEKIGEIIGLIGTRITSAIPEPYSALLLVIIFALLITLYCLFIWTLSENLAKRDLLKLNLAKYNNADHPAVSKFFGILLYIAEYILLLPFFVFLWFSVLAIIILLMSSQSVAQVLALSAAIVISTRVLAYYQGKLAEMVSTLFPLTILAISVTTVGFFSLERIGEAVVELPLLVSNIWLYFLLVIAVELVLRFLELLQDAFFPESI